MNDGQRIHWHELLNEHPASKTTSSPSSPSSTATPSTLSSLPASAATLPRPRARNFSRPFSASNPGPLHHAVSTPELRPSPVVVAAPASPLSSPLAILTARAQALQASQSTEALLPIPESPEPPAATATTDSSAAEPSSEERVKGKHGFRAKLKTLFSFGKRRSP